MGGKDAQQSRRDVEKSTHSEDLQLNFSLLSLGFLGRCSQARMTSEKGFGRFDPFPQAVLYIYIYIQFVAYTCLL